MVVLDLRLGQVLTEIFRLKVSLSKKFLDLEIQETLCLSTSFSQKNLDKKSSDY